VQFQTVAASAITPAAAVTAMQTAAGELATLVKGQILAKGASRVAVMTLPDASTTPQFSGLSAAQKGLLSQLSAEFNTKLLADLADTGVRTIDVRALNASVLASPSTFGLGNVTSPACAAVAWNPSATSLLCNAAPAAQFTAAGVPVRSSLAAGASASTYLFADGVHPTTAGHKILADQVWAAMKSFGWVPESL
jgi:phospholipase/lecithinase/hemolysin